MKQSKAHSKRSHRRQFIAWLTMELQKRGAILPQQTNYKAIQGETERLLLRESV